MASDFHVGKGKGKPKPELEDEGDEKVLAYNPETHAPPPDAALKEEEPRPEYPDKPISHEVMVASLDRAIANAVLEKHRQIMAKYPEFTDIADPYSKTTTGGGKGK
jgi:hypothetical protein